MINQQNVTIKSGSTWHKICPFPVGFIYLSQNSTSPATTFGGTWAALNEDRFLRPSNAWTTGGSKTISTKQLPSHSHNIRLAANAPIPEKYWDWSQTNEPCTYQTSTSDTSNAYVMNTGGGAEYWPYYRDCYGWYRTA